MPYTGQSADTLSAIANRLGMNWQDLYNANRDIIGGDFNLIRPGQTLRLPNETQSQPVQTGMSTSPYLHRIQTPQDFSKDSMSFEDYYNRALAQQGVNQQMERFIQPELTKAMDTNLETYANRNLMRSGLRGKAEEDILTNIAKTQQTMGEQLMQTREQEAQTGYEAERKRYESAPSNYLRPIKKETTPTAPQVEPERRQANAYRYGIGRTEGTPNKYGQSYMDWYKGRFGNLNI